MKLTKEEQKICDEYSERIDGKVRCNICPLSVGDATRYDFRCKANSHYDKEEGDWVYD